MAKAKGLSVFECDKIYDLHKQGLSQCAIIAKAGHTKADILNFLKDPEDGLWDKKVVDPNTFHPNEGRH